MTPVIAYHFVIKFYKLVYTYHSFHMNKAYKYQYVQDFETWLAVRSIP
jgi:hypothetical protein